MKYDFYPLSERKMKILELGDKTAVLLELYIKNPKMFKAKKLLDELITDFKMLELDKEEIGGLEFDQKRVIRPQ